MIAGEPMTDAEIDMLHRSAHTFGIDEGQIILKENLTNRNDELAEKIVVQSIYERSDLEIKRRDTIIQNLEQELQIYKDKELPYNQIVKEIHAQYPEIVSISMTRGLSINPASMENTEQVTIILTTDKAISTENIGKLQQWLRVKLNFENIIISQNQQ
jgi:DNA primase large subunit